MIELYVYDILGAPKPMVTIKEGTNEELVESVRRLESFQRTANEDTGDAKIAELRRTEYGYLIKKIREELNKRKGR